MWIRTAFSQILTTLTAFFSISATGSLIRAVVLSGCPPSRYYGPLRSLRHGVYSAVHLPALRGEVLPGLPAPAQPQLRGHQQLEGKTCTCGRRTVPPRRGGIRNRRRSFWAETCGEEGGRRNPVPEDPEWNRSGDPAWPCMAGFERLSVRMNPFFGERDPSGDFR